MFNIVKFNLHQTTANLRNNAKVCAHAHRGNESEMFQKVLLSSFVGIDFTSFDHVHVKDIGRVSVTDVTSKMKENIHEKVITVIYTHKNHVHGKQVYVRADLYENLENDFKARVEVLMDKKISTKLCGTVDYS